MDYEDCIALIEEDRNATYVAFIHDDIFAFNGNAMKGFLLPGDRPEKFWRF